MAEKKLSVEKQKEWAQYLYLHEDVTYKEIGLKVGVHEKTVGDWARDGNWSAMRKTLAVTKEEVLRDLYTVLEGMKNEAKIAATDGDPLTQPNTDGIYKMTLAIKKLETETGVGPMIATFKKFITFLQALDFDFAQKVNQYADSFIKDHLKNY